MLKTLHGYVSRDLAKILLLTLIVLTLVMSLAGIVEPLRKQGLSGDQAVQIFGLLVPIMVSLTLPIAALFAATMVYGRLSQDNELLACRASGVSTLAMLRPGLVLGLVVAVVSMALSNFVSPALASFLEKKIEGDIKGILAYEIRTEGYFETSSMPYILHAKEAQVLPDGRLRLEGMVGVDTSNPDDVAILAAETAVVDFRQVNNRTYAGITMTNFSALDSLTGRIQNIARGRSEELPPLPSLVREKPALYDWHRLLAILEDPARHGEVQQKLQQFRREIRHSEVLEDIAAVIRTRRNYQKLQKMVEPENEPPYVLEYQLKGGDPKWTDKGTLRLESTEPTNRVVLRVVRGNEITLLYTADSATLSADWRALEQESYLSILLEGNVSVSTGGEGMALSRESHRIVGIPLPQGRLNDDEASPTELGQILAEPARFTSDPKLIAQINDLRENRVPKLRRETLGEIHSRLAYGVGCFLMVAFGAALGIVFRGGQVISAFALSLIPAATLIVVITMGKQLLSQEINPLQGVGAIWSGVLLLVVANAVAYWHLARR
ncbi:MAG: LptF/LptG family permease [Phycisphaerae bacterium]